MSVSIRDLNTIKEEIKRIINNPDSIKLNLGCGKKKYSDFVNVDVNPRVRPDIIVDLNHFPWPFKDEIADYVLMDNVIEHLDDVIGVVKELYRILKMGGIAEIRVPYWLSKGAHEDPTHKHTFSEKSFDFLKEGYITDFYTSDIKFDVKVERIWGFGKKFKIIRKLIGDELASLIPNAVVGLVFYLKKLNYRR